MHASLEEVHVAASFRKAALLPSFDDIAKCGPPYVAAGVLLLAGILKLFAFIVLPRSLGVRTGGIFGDAHSNIQASGWTGLPLEIFAAPFELWIAIWIILSRGARRAVLSAAAMFFAFALISACKMLLGMTSCNCFAFSLPLPLTMSLSLLTAITLWLSHFFSSGGIS